jgi:hypothetical protein
MKNIKRISIFCGHYGSGKTNIAVNYALALKEQGIPVRIADLDIVNPYFRTKDSADELEAAGIPLISPVFANTNVDLPALPQELYSLVQQTQTYAVMDVGGDDRGAYALGRYAPYIREENNFDMFCVVNFYRPLTTTPEEAADLVAQIKSKYYDARHQEDETRRCERPEKHFGIQRLFFLLKPFFYRYERERQDEQRGASKGF